jgi:hypothetical protein
MTKSKIIIDSVLFEVGPRRTKSSNGVIRWYNAVGHLHCDDGPAYISPPTGAKGWYRDGKRHRIDGPAMEWPDAKEWWVDGRQFTEDEFNLFVDQETGEVLVPPGKKLTHDKK